MVRPFLSNWIFIRLRVEGVEVAGTTTMLRDLGSADEIAKFLVKV